MGQSPCPASAADLALGTVMATALEVVPVPQGLERFRTFPNLLRDFGSEISTPHGNEGAWPHVSVRLDVEHPVPADAPPEDIGGLPRVVLDIEERPVFWKAHGGYDWMQILLQGARL